MRLHLMTWQEVERYLKRSTGVILPIGSTEQHGPMGLLGTDALCAETIAFAVGEAADAVVAPTVAVGNAHFHLDFAGSMALRPTTLTAVMVDMLTSFARHGFRHVYVINGHGGNVAPTLSAFHEVHAADSFAGGSGRLKTRLKNWWNTPAVAKLRAELYGDGEGYHATPSEIAITQHAYPDAIGVADVPPPPPLPADGMEHVGDNYFDAGDYRTRFPDGRVGSHSAMARPEHGRSIITEATREICLEYKEFCGL